VKSPGKVPSSKRQLLANLMEIGACRCLSSSAVPLSVELGPFLRKSKKHHGSEGLRTMYVFLRKMTRHKNKSLCLDCTRTLTFFFFG